LTTDLLTQFETQLMTSWPMLSDEQ